MKTTTPAIDEEPRTEASYSTEYFTDLLKRKDGTIHTLEVRNTELQARADYFRDEVIRLQAELATCQQAAFENGRDVGERVGPELGY